MNGRNKDGTFAKGNQFGVNPEGQSHFIRKKFLNKWDEVFSVDSVTTLKGIKEKNPLEFMRLGVSAFPKEQKIDLTNKPQYTEDELKQALKEALSQDGDKS